DATFKVTGTPAAAGVNLGSVTILSSDPVTGSYKVNVSVTGTVPVISVLDGTAIVANDNNTRVVIGSSAVDATSTPAHVFPIKNTGLAPLTITSITPTT